MRTPIGHLTSKHTALAASLALTGLFTAAAADAAPALDFANPAIALSNVAMVDSGTCIAKYAATLEDQSRPAAEIGQRVARRCARELSRSAGLATWMTGKPEDFAKNLKYAQQSLTTNTVLRYRAAY